MDKMSSSFEEPSEIIKNGYVWRDDRDTLPPSEYGKTCWTGKFLEGSVDADLKTFKLSRFNDEKFQFCLGRCPKGVRIHLQLNFTICHVDGTNFKYQHWWVYGLTEAHPIGSLRYAIRNPNDWWMRCVSIESVERTVVEKGVSLHCCYVIYLFKLTLINWLLWHQHYLLMSVSFCFSA